MTLSLKSSTKLLGLPSFLINLSLQLAPDLRNPSKAGTYRRCLQTGLWAGIGKASPAAPGPAGGARGRSGGRTGGRTGAGGTGGRQSRGWRSRGWRSRGEAEPGLAEPGPPPLPVLGAGPSRRLRYGGAGARRPPGLSGPGQRRYRRAAAPEPGKNRPVVLGRDRRGARGKEGRGGEAAAPSPCAP